MTNRIWLFLSKTIDFINSGIWRVRLEELPRSKSIMVLQLRTLLLAIRGFIQDKCLLRASSLTFFSLLSIVPVLAMAFGIAKGFGFERHLEKQLIENLPGQETVLLKVVEFARALLENTQGGMIAGVGMVLLLWSVIKLLGHIENAFNEIWEIKKPRPLGTKVIYYVFIMVVAPAFLVAAGSLTVYITTQLSQMTENGAMLGMFSPFFTWGIRCIPYCLIGLLLTTIYVFMPNARVKFTAGLMAGFLAGIAYVVLQWGYINFQVGIAKYNAIYGSFAALPLFLIWLQISWLIVLFGAQLSFAIQNVETYEFEEESMSVCGSFKRLLSLQITHLLIQKFAGCDAPMTPAMISKELKIPIRLVHQILFELEDSSILSTVGTDNAKEPAYQPACDINMMTVKYVMDALDRRGTDNIPVARTESFHALSDILHVFGEAQEKLSANRLLKDI